MKNLTRILALCALLYPAAGLRADTTVTVDAAKTWLGYMNVFNLPVGENPPAYVYGSSWGTADLCASFSGNTLTLSPNTIGDPNEFWYQNTSGTATPPNVGGPGQQGNKIMQASMYVESNGGALGGQTVTFQGNVSALTFTSAHSTVAFIRDFAPDYSSVNEVTVPLDATGAFSISLATINDNARHVQYGFQTTGVNVWVTDVAPFGSIVIDANAIVPGDPNVTVDPAKNWLGYMNVFNLPDPDDDGAFLPGVLNVLDPPALKAVFAGSTLTLSPYVNPVAELTDTFWYLNEDPIRGNKQMEANMYVQVPNGTLTGQLVNFSGVVQTNTLTSKHKSYAFIKEWDPDFNPATVSVSQVELVPGPFSINLQISNNLNKVVQYGFQTVGPNVVPGQEASFGSVVITSTGVTSAYQTWINSFDFSGFTNPDLTQTGDPEGDGKTNIEEFALNDNPTSGVSSGKVRSRVETVGADQALVLTLPVRGAPVFAGSPSKTATADQVVYTIEGSNNLGAFDQGVTEVTPASVDGLPATDSGWSYRSFRLDGAIGGGTPRGPQGFLRAGIAPAP